MMQFDFIPTCAESTENLAPKHPIPDRGTFKPFDIRYQPDEAIPETLYVVDFNNALIELNQEQLCVYDTESSSALPKETVDVDVFYIKPGAKPNRTTKEIEGVLHSRYGCCQTVTKREVPLSFDFPFMYFFVSKEDAEDAVRYFYELREAFFFWKNYDLAPLLIPCPRCGGTPVLNTRISRHTLSNVEGLIYCGKCELSPASLTYWDIFSMCPAVNVSGTVSYTVCDNRFLHIFEWNMEAATEADRCSDDD